MDFASTYLFKLGENKIPYILQKTSRRRSVGLCVMPNNQLIVRVPKRIGKKEIDEILLKRAYWIFKKQKYYQTFQHRFKSYRFISGETIPYLGREIQLEIQKNIFSDQPISFESDKLTLFLSDESKVPVKVLKWYRSEALREIYQSIQKFAPLFQVNPKKVTIRNQKQMWGSCTSKHHLSFNWRLVLLPLRYLDYVVAHELCHIVHLNHSKKFWNLLHTILPDVEVRRKWLKEHSVEYLGFPNL